MEIEEGLGAVAIVDEAIERRKERHTVGDGAIASDRGLGAPLALSRTGPRVPGSAAPGVSVRLGRWDRLGFRVTQTLGQIPQLLPSSTTDDRDSMDVKRRQHRANDSVAVPAMVPSLQSDRSSSSLRRGLWLELRTRSDESRHCP